MSKPTVFNEVLTIRVPPALTAALSKVAASELTTSSEVARRVLIEQLTRCGALKLPGGTPIILPDGSQGRVP